jgi:DNA replication and repair protein RecF
LAIYNETLVESGTALMLVREQFVSVLNECAARMHAQWSKSERLEVRYRPSLGFEVATQDAIAGAFALRLREGAAQERARRASIVGPHRDDLELVLDGHSLAAFGSQGQQRTAVLALKVAEYSVMQDRSGEAPLLLLDDVLSELDPARALAFMEGVGGFEQAFMTATHLPEGLPAARISRIENAQVHAA